MTKHSPENERIKRKYFAYLKEAKRHSEPTVDAAAKALSRFEEYHRHKSFKAFHFEQAVAFKRHLAEQTGKRSGERLSKATLHATLTQLRKFFFLAPQGNRATRRAFSIPMPTISTSQIKTRASPRLSGSGKRRHWSAKKMSM